MKTTNQRHHVSEWSAGFRELAEGRPFHIRSDFACARGDLLIVREYDEVSKTLTGRVGMFRITWVMRASDGPLPCLIPAGVVVLGLAPANVVLEERRAAPARASGEEAGSGATAGAPDVVASAAADPVACSSCGVRTARSLLNAGTPAACPLCAPLLRQSRRTRQRTEETVPSASMLTRMAGEWVRRTATELGMDRLYVSAVVAEALSRAVEEGTLSALPYPRLAG